MLRMLLYILKSSFKKQRMWVEVVKEGEYNNKKKLEGRKRMYAA